jgi:ABC-type microcin C transport system permease subunit YejB
MDDVQKLFREVADLNAEAQSQYFADRGIDGDLRREVESLFGLDRGR